MAERERHDCAVVLRTKGCLCPDGHRAHSTAQFVQLGWVDSVRRVCLIYLRVYEWKESAVAGVTLSQAYRTAGRPWSCFEWCWWWLLSRSVIGYHTLNIAATLTCVRNTVSIPMMTCKKRCVKAIYWEVLRDLKKADLTWTDKVPSVTLQKIIRCLLFQLGNPAETVGKTPCV